MRRHALRRQVLALLLFSLSAVAQDAAIDGDVKGADGKPVANAIIRIMRLDVNRNYQTKTDKKGAYFYGGLPFGFYAVAVQVDGKDVAGVTGIRTQPGEPLHIKFDLAATPAELEQRVKSELKKLGAEWSYVKAMPMQSAPPAAAPAPPTAEASRALAPAQKAATDKQMAERAAAIKQRDDLNTAFNSGIAAMQARQYDDAVAALSKASELDPKQDIVWANLGAAYSGLAATRSGADFDAAIQKSLAAFARAIELKPDDAATHYSYALALAKAKKLDAMQAEMKKSADLDPAGAYRTYYNAGVVLTNAGQNDAAADAFKMAIAAAPEEPRNAEAYYQYGVALVGKAQVGAGGKFVPVRGTAEAFQKYLALAPGGPNAQAARDMLTTLGSSVDTSFTNPKKKK